MHDANAWRTRFAEKIADGYSACSGIEAVALIGSVARGWADGYSDIELGVFWRKEPRDEDRLALIEQIGGTDWRPAGFDAQMQAWCEDYRYCGVKIDVGHWQTADMQGILADVVDRHDADLSRQTSVAALCYAVPLYGTPILQAWQRQASVYPEALAEAMVRQPLAFSPIWMLRMLAERGDFPLVRRNLAALSHRLFLLLCAVNRTYYPGHKWIPRVLAGFGTLPLDFTSRLDAALIASLSQAVEAFEVLIHQVLDLVESSVPGADVAAARVRLSEPPHYYPQAPVIDPSG